MIIKPKMRGFICTTAHPAGCAQNVREQIQVAKAHGKIHGPKRVLVIGASTGYGLASRITAAYCCSADTIGVSFERPASGSRTATAGWYNNEAFEKQAVLDGKIAKSINGDAFSTQVKDETIALIQSSLPGGKVDLVVYSVAAPKRKDPFTGDVYASVIKPIGDPYTGKTVDFHTGEVSTVRVSPATPEEVRQTVEVMGGADWLLWMQALKESDVLERGALTVAYSYIGPPLTHAIYKNGSIGMAKNDLEEKAREIDTLLSPLGGKSFISVNKGLVTQASAAIPVVPLYIALLFKIMKAQGTHENCIQQMVRMVADRLYKEGASADPSSIPVDQEGRIRMDDWEMEDRVQAEIQAKWDTITSENVDELTDLAGYRSDFYRMFGFQFDEIDYDLDVAAY